MKKLIYTLCILIAMLALTACSSKKDAGSYYEEGNTALESGRYEEACKSFEKAIALKNDKAIYYIQYGQALTKLGKYDEAIEQYQKAIVDVDSSITNANKKRALRGQGIAYYHMAEYEQAASLLKSALDMDTEKKLNTDIRSYLGQCYVQQEKYSEALAVYNALVEEVGSASIYAQRGSVNANAGNVEAAKQDFEKAIGLENKNYSLYLLYYKMLLSVKDEEGAKAVLEKAAALEPKTSQEYYQMAEVKFYQQDYEGALSILQGITSDSKEAYRLMGDIYYVAEDYNNAIECYLAFIKDNTQSINSTIYLNLSSCYIALKQYDDALTYVNLGLGAGDKISLQELQYKEVLIYEQQGDFNTAYEKAKAYVEAYPEDEQMQRELIFLSTRYKK